MYVLEGSIGFTFDILLYVASDSHAGRLNFDCSSANGILLFRETSKVICAYGGPALQRPTGSDPYGDKYKAIWYEAFFNSTPI
jgi:hypothetical protein